MKRLVVVGALLCLVSPVAAQTDPGRAPVDTLNCSQMQSEMTSAGQLMNQQMDPDMADNIQSMRTESQRDMEEARADAVGAGLICAVPGLGAACTVVMTSQSARQTERAEESRQQTDALANSMNEATAGIDIERMTAVADRWERERCDTSR
jgi:hypothetical protein